MENFDLKISNVTKIYDGGNVAVKDFNLQVEKGEFVAFLGPSGCGKTTTLKMVGGFEEPTKGEIYIKDKKVNHIPPNLRRTNMVFQNFALFPHMNVAENIEYGLKIKGINVEERKKKMNRMLELVQMSEYANRNIDELSGGQRQRIAIARSLILEPDILLLDEPLGALDANLRARVQVELKTLQKKLGITFVFVTHSQSEAMALADKIVVMSNGQIEQVGTPFEIYSSPKTKFVAQFIGKNNIMDGEVTGQEENKIELSTRYGTVVYEVNDMTFTEREKVSLVLRADQMQILSENEELEEQTSNYIRGKIVSEEFIGSIINYVIQTEFDDLFKVEQHESLRNTNLRLNSQVILSWKNNEGILLRD